MNNKSIQNKDYKTSFFYLLTINKKYRIIYWLIPFIFLFLSFIIGIILITIKKNLFVPGIILIAIAFLIIITMFFLNYYEKKCRNKTKEYFQLDKILNQPFIDNKIINKPLTITSIDPYYLNHYHYSINTTKEIKWHSKTFLANNDLYHKNFKIRASYIANYNDDSKFLWNKKFLTQMYLEFSTEISEKIIIVNKNNIAYSKTNFHIMTINEMKIFSNKIFKPKNNFKKIFNLISLFDKLKIEYEILIENKKINIYWIKNKNYLFLNLELKKFDEKILNNEITELINIINTIY